MRKTITITLGILITTIYTSSFCMFCIKSSQSKYEEKFDHESLYSEADLSNELNVPIFPSTSTINENTYFPSFSIKTICNNKIWTMTIDNIDKEKNIYESILISKKAYEVAFPGTKRYPHYSKRYHEKSEKNQKIWKLLKKTLDEHIKKKISTNIEN